MKKDKLSIVYSVVLILVALVFDLFSWVPFAHVIAVSVAQITLAMLFKLKGIDVLSTRRIVIFATTWIVELIPALNVLPMITVQTIIFILMVKMGDKKVDRNL